MKKIAISKETKLIIDKIKDKITFARQLKSSNISMKVVKGFLIFLNIVLLLMTLGAYLAPLIPSKGTGFLPTLGLVFPGLMVMNLLFIILWFFLKSKWALASSITLLLGLFFAPSTLNFLQSSSPSSQRNPIQVGTYNMQFSKPIAFLSGTAQEQKEKDFDLFLKKIDYLDILGVQELSLIHISEPTRRYAISYAVFC